MDASWNQRIQMASVQLVPFIMAVVFHEFAHGWVANRWGDPTAKDRGRLTLNPIPHMDLIGTVAFPLINMLTGIPILIGWAKPVPIDPRRFRKFRPALFWVAFAGPGMNFSLAILSAFAFCAIQLWVPQNFYLFEPLITMCYVSVLLNYALGLFNLIPLPPLDGSKMVQAFLPMNAIRRYESISRYSLMILIVFFVLASTSGSHLLQTLEYPIDYCTKLTLFLVARLFNLPV